MKIRNKLEQLKGERSQVKRNIQDTKRDIKEANTKLKNLEKAREIVRTVGLETQQQLQYHISDVASLALEAVFDNPYELQVEFVQRRNKTECDLLFNRNQNIIDPLDSSGYGAADIASFALRVASWSMKQPKSRAVIIMDEPFKNLSQDKQGFASQMLKEISDKLNVQFIIVTHEETLTETADKQFHVYMKNECSYVR